jgi:hypothetical protein
MLLGRFVNAQNVIGNCKYRIALSEIYFIEVTGDIYLCKSLAAVLTS